MKINIELNKKSIQNAKKLLKKQEKILTEQVIPEFMLKAADWIKLRANEILNSSDIGVEIVQNITSSWHIDIISNTNIVLYNMSWKSAYVEFGVGIVGQSMPHPNASKTNYEYNVDSPYKYSDGGWAFSVADQSELDIPKDAIIEQNYSSVYGLTIYTRGTQGVWYLFNAMEDFKLREEKRLWEEIKKKYWS
jgi:hypothetical protein